MADKDCKKFCTSIGGQAVIEGVMMRGPKDIAVSVRKSDGEIVTDLKPVKSVANKKGLKWLKWPIIRGCVNFIESMIVGIRALTFSADFFDVEEEESESKFDKWLEEKLGDKMKDIAIGVSLVLSLFMTLGLFVFLPTYLVKFFNIENGTLKTFVEGIVKLLIFLIYLLAVSRMKDIQRVFMYHGAEHKTIHCYEAGEELTVENVKRHSRLHPRCGTSFLLIVMVISVLIFLLVPNNEALAWYARVGWKILLLPIVAGVAYEIIKFAGRHDNWFTRIISAPGMWFQYITTNEPDDSQIEVAITSLNAVKPENKEDSKW